MSLVDAQGNPTSPSLDETMASVIQHLNTIGPIIQNNATGVRTVQQQILELSFLTEYVINKLSEQSLFEMQETDYANFRQTKIAEIQAMQTQRLAELEKAQKETVEVNLEEDE